MENDSLAMWRRVANSYRECSHSRGQDVGTVSHPFRLYVKEVSIAKTLFRQADQKSNDVSINVLLFDSKSMTFDSHLRGTTKTITLANKAAFEMPVYFYLDRLDSSRFIVVEVLSVQKSASSAVEELCVGFVALRLDSPDSSLRNVKLIGGSSRALLFMEDPTKLSSTLSDDCQITLSLQTWPKLEAIRQLMPANFLVHSATEIPGVASGNINAEFPGIGIDHFHDPHALQFTSACHIASLSVKMRPDVTTVESSIQNNLCVEVEQNLKSAAKMKVAYRRLKFGLHNGFRYVSDPSTVQLNLNNDGGLSIDATSSQDQLLHLPRHPAFAVLFLLEIGFSETAPSSIFKKSTPPKMYSVFAGWAAICPFGTSQPLSASITLQMISQDNGYGYSPDEVLSSNLKGVSALESNPAGIFLNLTIREDSVAHQSQPFPVLPTATAPLTVSVPAVATPHQPQATEMVPFQYQQQMATPRSFHPMTAQSVAPVPEMSLQKPWPVEVRHLVDDDSKTTLIGTTIVHRHPTGRNLAVTPVHIPMPPLAPLSVASLPRAAYAQLYAAGFPIIRDRHGDLPEVIDPTSTQSQWETLNFAAEKADPLQGNEIVLQFLALSSFSHATTASLDQPQCVFFTFHFYNFPPVQTERMLMTCGDKLVVNDANERLSSIFILRGIDPHTGSLAVQPPGCQVKFAVDSSVLKPGEEDAFWQYLLTQSMHIDIWDGDSMLLIGSCSVPIRFLLRQGKEAVQMTLEMDVFSTEYGSLTSNIIADVTRAGSARYIDVSSVLKGRLHLRLANIGYVSEIRPISGRFSTLSKIYGGVSTGRLPIIESQNAQVGNQGASSLDKRLGFLADNTNRPATGRTRIGHGAHLLEAAGNRALVDPGGLVGISLASDLMNAASAGETIDERARKLDRFKKLLAGPEVKGDQAATLAHGAAVVAYKHTRELRERNYKNLESYRDRMKHQSIIGLLCDSITSHHEIVTSFGKAEYFEFMLRNPTNEQHIVRIESQDSDLTLVTDVNEWRYFRKVLGEPTSVVEEKMFNADASSPLVPEVFIKPREIIRIPFKYQTFKGYKPNDENEQAGKQVENNLHKSMAFDADSKQISKTSPNSRVLTVHFTSITDKGEHIAVEGGDSVLRPLAVLEVSVKIQPHATDQVFRFYSPENAFLRKAIRLPPCALSPPGSDSHEFRKFSVRCSEPSLIAEVKSNGPNEPQDIMLRVAVGASPGVNNALLAIFSDPYLSRPLQIWELWIHALQRYDVTCVEGETSKFSLVLRGSNSTRLVRCYTSHATELLVEPAIPFMLVANSVHELSFVLKPLTAGQRLMVVNVVDVQLHQLIRSWLVCVSAEPPAYSTVYDLVLPCGPAGQTHNKKLAYKNPFGRTHTFYLKTNRSDLLSLRETSMPQMAPGEIRDIGLRFVASHAAGTAELAVYVNDQGDRNVESVLIRLAYVAVGPSQPTQHPQQQNIHTVPNNNNNQAAYRQQTVA